MLKAFFILLALVSPAFAQVTSDPTFADQAWGLLLTVTTAAVPILTGFLAMMIRSQWRFTGALLSQALLDKLNAGILAFIRAEIEKRRLATGATKAEAAAAAPVTAEAKRDIVASVQPKIERAFKETLAHFGKEPGSEAVTDMILGRVEEAIKPAAVPHVVSK